MRIPCVGNTLSKKVIYYLSIYYQRNSLVFPARKIRLRSEFGIGVGVPGYPFHCTVENRQVEGRRFGFGFAFYYPREPWSFARECEFFTRLFLFNCFNFFFYGGMPPHTINRKSNEVDRSNNFPVLNNHAQPVKYYCYTASLSVTAVVHS